MRRSALASLVLFVAAPALAQQAPAPAAPPVGPDWSKINVTTTDLGKFMEIDQVLLVPVAVGEIFRDDGLDLRVGEKLLL